MTTDRPAVYAARMDVEPSYLEQFERWYETKHAPDLLRSGFLSCVAYHAIEGTPLVHNFYLIPTVDIFTSHDYQAARTPEEDPQRPEVLSNVSSRSNTPYRQFATWGRDASEPVWAQYLATIEFGDAPLDDEAAQAVARAIEDADVSVPLRLCLRDGVHPNNPQRPGHAIVVVEADTEDDARSGLETLNSRLVDSHGPLTSSLLRRATAMSATG